jgi:hypothetical protein
MSESMQSKNGLLSRLDQLEEAYKHLNRKKSPINMIVGKNDIYIEGAFNVADIEALLVIASAKFSSPQPSVSKPESNLPKG